MGVDDRLAEILWEWRERRDEGEYVDTEDVIAAHPDLAGELRARFAALAAVDEVFAASLLAPTVPRRIGAFAVQREIGSGGMGTVYLADVADAVPGINIGERVALKVLHGHLLARPGFFRRFLREADVGRSVQHDNVVRVFGADAALVRGAQLNFLVMEYVEGRTLADLLRDLGVVPEALLREIAGQVTDGLTAIHQAGIVHRDIKPENLLITEDQRVQIMDLGIARDLGASAPLTRQGEFAGSLPYASPEQFGKGDVGPAADLYALGVVLYELATGINPFRADDVSAVMRAQLELVPSRVRERNPDISEFLSELVAVLLEKAPGDRIQSATALSELLAAGERSPWWAERERALRETSLRLPRVPVRRETRLYGREDDLQLLRECWDRARSGAGNTVLLEGEAGIGKSRLVDAFVRELTDQDAHVLYGSYPPAGGMGGLTDAVVGQFGAADLGDVLAPYLVQTPSLVPAFAALLTHGLPPEETPLLGADAVHAVFCHLMRNLAAHKPLVWIVDDLHFASADSRAIVLSMARSVESHGVLLVATTRPGLPEEELAHFARTREFRRERLGRLSPREVIELLRDAFRSEALAEKLGGRIAFKSDGVPFFVFEMIRGLEEGQFITKLPDGTWVETRVVEQIDVPSAVRDLIDVRLGDLSADERALLDVGAVHGYEFDPDLVARVVDRNRFQVLQSLAGIERASGVVRASGRAYRFDHHQIQEVVYEDLSDALREECHALLFEAMKRRDGVDAASPAQTPPEIAHSLAHHGLRGNRPADALPFLHDALDHLQGSYQNDALLEMADLALSTPELLRDQERLRVLLRQIEVLDLLGRREAQAVSLDSALALADACGTSQQQAQVRWRKGRYLLSMSRWDDGRAELEPALAKARDASDELLAARIMGGIGSAYARQGLHEKARPYFESYVEAARRAGDRATEVRAVGYLSTALVELDDKNGAVVSLQHCLDMARASGDQRLVASTLGHLANALKSVGRLTDAATDMQESIELSRRVGQRDNEAASTGNLGLIRIWQERYDDAAALFERHAALSREIGSRHGENIALGNLAMVSCRRGRHEEALQQFRNYLKLARDLGARLSERQALLNLGSMMLIVGRLAEALCTLEEGQRLAGELGGRFESATLCLLAIAHRRLGRTARAREAVADALRAFEAHGSEPGGIDEANVLSTLAEIERDCGNIDEAERLQRRALAQRRESGLAHPLAANLIAMGDLLAAIGQVEEAHRLLREAVDVASSLPGRELSIWSKARLAALGEGDPRQVANELEENETRVSHECRMTCRFLLWQATRDSKHLGQAWQELAYVRAHAPEDCRQSMLENVLLHREIVAAWKEHGEGS